MSKPKKAGEVWLLESGDAVFTFWGAYQELNVMGPNGSYGEVGEREGFVRKVYPLPRIKETRVKEE